MKRQLRQYYILAKPGIVYGNSFALIGALIYGANGVLTFNYLMVVIASSLVIAAACVGNNMIEVSTDREMKRTEKRPLVSGEISLSAARWYLISLLTLGLGLLLYFGNLYAVLAAVLGFISYVFIYTPLKKVTYHSTLIGSVPGAMPPVIGYTASAGRVDEAAALFFASLVFWQMPHFYAIALRRHEDYSTAKLPTIISERGVTYTQRVSFVYAVLFLGTIVLSIKLLELSSWFYIVGLISTVWIWFMVRYRHDLKKWAKTIFSFSLLILILWSVFIAIEGFIR